MDIPGVIIVLLVLLLAAAWSSARSRKTSIDTRPGAGSLATPSVLPAGAEAMTSANCR
jgi:hypothetical protein